MCAGTNPRNLHSECLLGTLALNVGKELGRNIMQARIDTRVVKGRVVEINLENGTYKVCYLLVDEVEEWFNVSDLTSVTRHNIYL